MAAVSVLLLLAVTAVCSGSLVVVNSGVEVTRGRSAFITEKELKISVDPTADCKVEVVMNEPVTQRVGRLTPQVRTHLLQSSDVPVLCGADEPVQWCYWCFVSRCLTAASFRTR